MSNKEKAEYYVNHEALNKAIDEMLKDTENKDDKFKKTYDPHTSLNEIATDIDKSDKACDNLSLGISGIFVSFIPMFILDYFFEYTPLEFLSPMILLLILTLSIFLIIISEKKRKELSKKLIGHRFAYLDKLNLRTLLDDRNKKKNVAIAILITSFIIGISFIMLLDGLYFAENISVAVFFFFISVGLYLFNTANMRFKNIKKILSSSIE